MPQKPVARLRSQAADNPPIPVRNLRINGRGEALGRRGSGGARCVVKVGYGGGTVAATRQYHEKDRSHQLRDAEFELWGENVATVMLSPEKGCRIGDLVDETMQRLDDVLGQHVEYAAWRHDDTQLKHAHLIVKLPVDVTRAVFEKRLVQAVGASYSKIRDRQREYAQRRERDRAHEHDPLARAVERRRAHGLGPIPGFGKADTQALRAGYEKDLERRRARDQGRGRDDGGMGR